MRRLLLATTTILAAVAGHAAAADSDTAQVDEVIVTATKRAENLQDVPLAVSAFGAEALRRAGVEDTRQLMALAPSLNLNVTTSDSAGVVIRLRGLGSEAINPGLESAVATFIDGVYRSRSNLSLAAVPGIERVEVLRGPQGTLFGKNTSSGLINVVTHRPDFDAEGEASASFGNYGYQQYVLGVTGPLVAERLAARLDAAYTRRDGWLTDFSTDRKFREKNQWTIRGQVLWTPSDAVSARFIVDTSQYDQMGPDTYAPKIYDPVYRTLATSFGAATTLGLEDLNNTITRGRDSRELNRTWGASAEVTWDLGFGELTSITGYRDWRNKQAREVDYSEVDLVYIPYGGARQEFQTFTQELRLAGETEKLDWLLGAFYSHEDLTATYGYKTGRDLEAWYDRLLAPSTGRTNPISFYTGLPVGQSLPDGVGWGEQRFDQTASSYAAFTQETLHLTDRLSLTGGIRYTHERKSVNINFANPYNPGCNALIRQGRADTTPVSGIVCLQLWDPRYAGRYRSERSESAWSGVVTLAYEVADDINTYVTWSRGYKAGGFIIDPSGFKLITQGPPNADDTRFDPESATNLEAGLKMRLLDRRLTVNSAVFRTRITDYQLSYNTGAALITRNIPEVESRGVEVEASVRPVPAWSGSVNVAYADAQYGDFPPTLVLPANIRLLEGRRLHNAPLWTVTAALGWEDEVAEGLTGFAHLDGRYQSAVMTERTLRVGSDQKEYITLNGRMGVTGGDGQWTVELWARNLTDERYFVSSIPATFQGATLVGVPGEPRMWGVTLRAAW
jgi:iron complex outermembrane receptor protein